MQISRQLLVTCAVAACLTPTLVHAFDNEAQIRARQALEQKMQTEVQTPPATSAPPVVVSKPPSNTAVTKPAVPIPASSSEEQMRARQALEEKMNEMQTQAPPATPAPPVAVKKPKVVKAKPVEPQPQPPVVPMTPSTPAVENPPVQTTPAFAPEISQPATPAPVMSAPPVSAPVTDNAANDKLNEALHQKMRETEAEPPVMPAPVQKPEAPQWQKPAAPPVVKVPPAEFENHIAATPPPAVAPAYAPIPQESNTARPNLPEIPMSAPAPAAKGMPVPQPTLSLPALSGPPSPLAASKQQKLDALLQQYRADQLTPQQYHEQRAKILAEP